MILKSYIIEQNINLLKSYRATLIYGENDGIKDDIKEDIEKQNKDCEILKFFEPEILKENILYKNIANQSLFSQKKIIFIQQVTDKIFSQIEDCVEEENADVKIYLFADNLEKKSKLRNFFEKDKTLASFACYKDNERTLVTYINKHLKDYKGLSGEIINLLISNSNQERKTIKNEILKIKDYFLDKKINKEQTLEILNTKNDVGFNEIRDKALLGEKIKINKLLSEAEILNDEVFYYLNSLNYRIMRLQEILKKSEGSNNYEQTIDSLKPPVFWKDKPLIIQQLQKWTETKLEEILLKIGETEVLMKKNSYIRNDIVIKDLIIHLTGKAATS
jgi:DNA polymerase III subunit delta